MNTSFKIITSIEEIMNPSPIERELGRKLRDDEKAAIVKSFNQSGDGWYDSENCIQWGWNANPPVPFDPENPRISDVPSIRALIKARRRSC